MNNFHRTNRSTAAQAVVTASERTAATANTSSRSTPSTTHPAYTAMVPQQQQSTPAAEAVCCEVPEPTCTSNTLLIKNTSSASDSCDTPDLEAGMKNNDIAHHLQNPIGGGDSLLETSSIRTLNDRNHNDYQATTVSATLTDLPRLVLRNRPFYQSSNKIHIQHNQGSKIYKLLRFNWFHTFMRWPTTYSLLTLMSIWTGMILLFAAIYVWYDRLDNHPLCGLGQGDEEMGFGAAFAFSLETCTTVGYGLPHGINAFFEESCSSLQTIIYFQMAWSMIFNAFLLTFLYSRLGRSESRSAQVVCSNKALVSVVDGQVRFQVRCFDVDAKHPVVESHVRMYCVMKHRPVPRPLRILQPDDEMGGMLFLSFPSIITHHIDLYSLLHPPSGASTTIRPSGLVLRQVDGMTANKDDCVCPVCGESYGTLTRWKQHVKFQRIVEEKDGYPVEGTHLALDMEEIERQTNTVACLDVETLKQHFKDNISEIICLIEGIDPLTSGTFQALQSYRFEDIVWEENSQFAPCLTVAYCGNSGQRMFTVDLERYHDIVPDPDRSHLAGNSSYRPGDNSYRPGGSTVASTPSIRKVEKKEVPANANDANNNTEETKPKRQRHRRVKTSSNRPGDALFVEPELLKELQEEQVVQEFRKHLEVQKQEKDLQKQKSLPV